MKKAIIGLLTGLALMSFISCKGEVESGGDQQGGDIPTGNFKHNVAGYYVGICNAGACKFSIFNFQFSIFNSQLP